MPDIRFTLPAALIVLPTALVVVAVVACRARRESTRTIVARVALVAYGAAVVATTLFPFDVVIGRYADAPGLGAVQLLPLVTADPVGLLLNAVLFIPLGVLLPEVVRGATWRRAAVVGFVVSLGIELVQLGQSTFLGGGRAFDVDDLLANTAGALLGWSAYRAVAWAWSATGGAPSGTGLSSRPHAEP